VVTIHCPTCGLPILPAEITPAGDLAYCRLCERTSTVDACRAAKPLAQRPASSETPPKGLQLTENLTGFQIVLSTASWVALILWPFMFVWAGGSLSGIYGPQIKSGEFSWLMSLFGLPFLAGSVILFGVAFMSTFGRVIVESGQDGLLRIRKGGLGLYWTKSAAWMDVVSAEVVEETRRRKGNYTTSYACVLQQRQGALLKIDTGADQEQAAWLARYLAGRIYLRR
jgi:hypothetical protein